LVVGPRLLLADEPTGNHDPRTGAVVLDQLFAEAERAGTTVLVVTHDHSLLARFEQVIDLESPEPGGGS
ncbi:MAG: ABC transporter ATP-binding protein, partial [Planctomycetota bacterium]